jgi:hypothetical protein
LATFFNRWRGTVDARYSRLEEGMFDLVPIERAVELIHQLLPDEAAGWRKVVFSPDYILQRAKELEATLCSTRISRWEQRDDEELVTMLVGSSPGFAGELLVITDACLGGAPQGVAEVNGAFSVGIGLLFDFVESYRLNVTPHFIDGDVLIVSPVDRRINVFHHEGMVTHIQLKLGTCNAA